MTKMYNCDQQGPRKPKLWVPQLPYTLPLRLKGSWGGIKRSKGIWGVLVRVQIAAGSLRVRASCGYPLSKVFRVQGLGFRVLGLGWV